MGSLGQDDGCSAGLGGTSCPPLLRGGSHPPPTLPARPALLYLLPLVGRVATRLSQQTLFFACLSARALMLQGAKLATSCGQAEPPAPHRGHNELPGLNQACGQIAEIIER